MKIKFLVLPLIFLSFFYYKAAAQIDVEGKVKDKSVDRVDQRTDEGIDEGLDAVEEGVKNLFKKKDKSENTDEEGSSEPASDTDENANASNKPAKQETPKLSSYTKYDFVPGDQLILYEDFSQDAIGDFPALWTTNGSGEVRTLNLYPGNWLYMNSVDNVYCLMKNLSLPENFILEFDVIPTSEEESASLYFSMYESNEEEFLDNSLLPGNKGFHLSLRTWDWLCQGYNNGDYGIEGSSTLAPVEKEKLNHIIVWVQKRRLRVYHKGQKTLDLPTVIPDQIKINRLRFSLYSQNGLPYISNIRFTTAAPDMRSKLLTEGKIVSYGIYFDVNSDKLKPESNGTLKEIATVLKENPDVKVKIVGHTDGDGDAAKNLDLSKRRAASVKSELTATFGIDGSRIVTDGKGKTEPVAPNDTPGNKAKNRRVEFIKM